MKTGTIDKLKFCVLKSKLGKPKWQVVGVLQSLWYLTTTSAPEGDIGRFTNIEIAAWMEWSGDPEELIDALVESGWLDSCPKYRLIVHDWEAHCPNFVKGSLKSQNKPFAKPQANSGGAKGGARPQAKPPTIKSSQTKPNQTSTSKVKLATALIDWGAAIAAAKKADLTICVSTPKEKEFLLRAAALAQAAFSENWFWDAVEGVRTVEPTPTNKPGYFRTCLKRSANGEDVNALLKRIELPANAIENFDDPDYC